MGYTKRDTGYAWVVCLASFVCHILVYGIIWTVAVFYTLFKDAFPNGSGEIALITSLVTAMTYGTGPLSGILTNKYGARAMTIAGGLLCGIGLSTSAFANNIYHLYGTFGVLTGAGFGLAYIPSISVVGWYFENKRTIALGLAVSGCGIGTFVFPPLIQFLDDQFGWRGVLLVTGAISLNICVCGAFFRPINLPSLEITDKDSDDNCDIKKLEVPEYNKYKIAKDRFYRTVRILNLSICKNVSYLCLCFNNFFFCFGLSITYVHLSAYGSTVGLSVDQGAILVSVLGICNFIGRVAFGLLAHAPQFSAICLYTVAFFASGAATVICVFAFDFWTMTIYAASFGFLTASLGTLLPQLIVEFLEERFLTNGYGYLLVFEALGTLLGAPVAGWLFDSTQVYHSSFYLGGSSIMFSAFIMVYPWWFASKQRHALIQEMAVVDIKIDNAADENNHMESLIVKTGDKSQNKQLSKSYTNVNEIYMKSLLNKMEGKSQSNTHLPISLSNLSDHITRGSSKHLDALKTVVLSQSHGHVAGSKLSINNRSRSQSRANSRAQSRAQSKLTLNGDKSMNGSYSSIVKSDSHNTPLLSPEINTSNGGKQCVQDSPQLQGLRKLPNV